MELSSTYIGPYSSNLYCKEAGERLVKEFSNKPLKNTTVKIMCVEKTEG